MEDAVLMHCFRCLATDQLTGRRSYLQREIWMSSTQAWMILRFEDGHRETVELNRDRVLWMRSLLFPGDDGGSRAPATITRIDGTPALSRLRERLRLPRASPSLDLAALLALCLVTGVAMG